MSQTIAAIATPPLPSAIGILRLSGDGAIEAAAAVFRPAGGKSLAEYESRRLVYGTLLGPDGAPIDQALATVSRAPRSYTGEDTAEFQCHGSPAVLQLGLEALLAQGVRQAGPGEFTRRAFLNGKLDLTQAEAVADLIDAETPAAVRQAAGQLSGALGRRVGAIYDGLVDLMAHFHAVLDYPDEDIDPFRADTIRAGLEEARAGLSALLATYERGRYIAGGVPCVLVGRPNAGKSSLLNALVGYDRAIVTDVPGTTRDTVEARCKLGGVVLKLIDTAGLRDRGPTGARGETCPHHSGSYQGRLALRARPVCESGSAAPNRDGERQNRSGTGRAGRGGGRPLPHRRGGGGRGAAHQRPPGRGRPPGPGGGGAGRGEGDHPRRPAHRCGGGPVRPGGAHRGQRAGGCDRPHLPAVLRGQVGAKQTGREKRPGFQRESGPFQRVEKGFFDTLTNFLKLQKVSKSCLIRREREP